MATISTINTLSESAISTLNGIAKSAISTFDGVSFPVVVPDSIYTDTDSLTFTYMGGQAQILVTSSGPWTASIGANNDGMDINLSTYSGNSGDVVGVTVGQGSAGFIIECDITFFCGTASTTVHVTQESS